MCEEASQLRLVIIGTAVSTEHWYELPLALSSAALETADIVVL